MTVFEQLDYFNEQKKLLLNNSNFNGAFTKDNLELFNISRSNQELRYTLVAFVLACHVINPDVVNSFSNVSNIPDFMQIVLENFNKAKVLDESKSEQNKVEVIDSFILKQNEVKVIDKSISKQNNYLTVKRDNTQ